MPTISAMRIDALKNAPDRAGRYWVTFSDGSRLGLYRQTVEDFGLYPGKELDEQELERLNVEAGKMSAKMRAVRIVSASSVSKRDLQQRLVRKGEDPEQAEAAVAWLEELHLIDDLETAKQLVRSASMRGYGAARAKSILYEKGIPKELWDEALAELSEMDDAIDTFLRRKLDGRTLDAKQIKKTVDALLRRGHSYHDIQAGLRRYEASLSLEQTQEDTWEDME